VLAACSRLAPLHAIDADIAKDTKDLDEKIDDEEKNDDDDEWLILQLTPSIKAVDAISNDKESDQSAMIKKYLEAFTTD
jgi:hypothetical protein